MSNPNTNVTKLTPAQLPDAITALMTAKVPAFIWGSPGIGKSAITNELAKLTGRPVHDVRASQLDAVDTRGLPMVKDGQTSWATPDFWPTEHDSKAIILLDELNSAPAMVLAALYQLILDRRLGDYCVPDGVDIIACGNLETDRGVTTRMPTPLANRFAHLYLETSLGDWCKWAFQNSIPMEVIAFLRFRPDLLHNFDPKSGEKAFPTPRSWEFLSKVFNRRDKMAEELSMAIYSGIVGQGAAVEFTSFLQVFSSLPNIDNILLNPDSAEVPTDPSALYAVCGALSRLAATDNFKRVYTYAKRLPREFTVLLVRDSAAREPKVQHTKAFTEFGIEFADVLT